ncbi:hypothetical protein EEB14_58575 [Rhodococcus sp. WS4]|nr:hypothetical protein EEB14_58575 [Rhodococcus sp. WS4]
MGGGSGPRRRFSGTPRPPGLPVGQLGAYQGRAVTDAASLSSALDGVHSMFLLSRLGSDADILDAARGAGVEHVVLVSITVQTHPYLGPVAENLAVERLLETSGMDWTILRPTQFASNTLLWAVTIRERDRCGNAIGGRRSARWCGASWPRRVRWPFAIRRATPAASRPG